MMKWKQILALTIAMIMVMAMVACSTDGTTGTPDASGTTTTGETPDPTTEQELYRVDAFSMTSNYAGLQGGWFGKIAKDKFNLEFNIVASNLDENKFAAMMATGDLGDLIVFGDDEKNMLDAIEAGLLLDWNEEGRLAADAPNIADNYQDAIAYNKATYGGGQAMYGLGHDLSNDSEGPSEGISMVWGPYLRWDLYEELGYPEINEMEDYLDVLKSMQEMAPLSDSGLPTYGFSFWNDWDGSHMMNAKQFACLYGFNDDSGGFVLHHASENKYQDLLDPEGYYLRTLQMYFDANQMGLVDPDSISQTFSDVSNKITDGQVFFSWFSWLRGYNTDTRMNEGKALLMVPMKEQQVYSYGMSTYGGNRTLTIGKNADHPERLLEFINWCYSEEGLLTMNNGPEGLTWEYGEDGHPVLTDFGVSMKFDSSVVVPEEFGGGEYADGQCQLNFSWNAEAMLSPNGYYYNSNMWPDWLEKKTTTAEQNWQEHFGVMTEREYFEKNDARAVYKVVFMDEAPEVMSQDMSQIQGNISSIITTNSWKMVFAKDQTEFDAVKADMIEKAKGLGYDDIVDWYVEQLEKEFAYR